MKLLKDELIHSKIVFIGDSITHNWVKYTHDMEENTENKNLENYELGDGQVSMLNDVCHFQSITNLAVSGGCYINCSDVVPGRQAFRSYPYQIEKGKDAIQEADEIIIMLGTNDYSEQLPFGDYTDVATDKDQKNMTFYGAMNYGLNRIKEFNPNARIHIVNILNRVVPVETKNMYCFSYHEYNLAIRHFCHIHGLDLIDVSDLFQLNKNFPGDSGIMYTKDGLHPNKEGYIAITNAILNHIVD